MRDRYNPPTPVEVMKFIHRNPGLSRLWYLVDTEFRDRIFSGPEVEAHTGRNMNRIYIDLRKLIQFGVIEKPLGRHGYQVIVAHPGKEHLHEPTA